MKPRLLFGPILVAAAFAVFPILADADDSTTDRDEAYWEYGAGIGGAHYEQYPAADQFSDLILPFPTFQYRGRILRADDREGARAYLFKSARLNLEFSGAGFPALDSSNNEARKGMDNLPWMIALGPQLVSQLSDDWQASLGWFQGITTDFDMTRFQGQILEGRLSYRWQTPLPAWRDFEAGESYGRVYLVVKGGSKDFHALYFDVPRNKVRPNRAYYESKEGLFSSELSYFQSFKSGRTTLYIGAALTDYSQSANRGSPLHKSDLNISYVAGATYLLGESKRPGVPESETGILRRGSAAGESRE